MRAEADFLNRSLTRAAKWSRVASPAPIVPARSASIPVAPLQIPMAEPGLVRTVTSGRAGRLPGCPRAAGRWRPPRAPSCWGRHGFWRRAGSCFWDALTRLGRSAFLLEMITEAGVGDPSHYVLFVAPDRGLATTAERPLRHSLAEQPQFCLLPASSIASKSRVTSLRGPIAVCDTEPAQSCGVT